MSAIHDMPHVPLSARAVRLSTQLIHPLSCAGGAHCSCGIGLELLIIEQEARASLGKINALGAAWSEAEAALPEGWYITQLELVRLPTRDRPLWQAVARQPMTRGTGSCVSELASSQAGALRSLAERARDIPR